MHFQAAGSKSPLLFRSLIFTSLLFSFPCFCRLSLGIKERLIAGYFCFFNRFLSKISDVQDTLTRLSKDISKGKKCFLIDSLSLSQHIKSGTVPTYLKVLAFVPSLFRGALSFNTNDVRSRLTKMPKSLFWLLFSSIILLQAGKLNSAAMCLCKIFLNSILIVFFFFFWFHNVSATEENN